MHDPEFFPAVFFQEEGETDYTVVFPDLNIFTDGKTLVEAFLFVKFYKTFNLLA